MDKIPDFVNKNTNTPKINADAEAELSSLLSHSGAGGGGMPPLTIKQELDERIELLRFLIDAFTKVNFVGEESTVLNTFKEKCEPLLKITSVGKTEKYMTGTIELIDTHIFSNEKYKKILQIVFTNLFQHAIINLSDEALKTRLYDLLSTKTKTKTEMTMYDRLKELQIIYRIGKLMKGGKPRRTRRQKQQKSRRRQKQRKSRRRL
jgi:hypothetical protein